MSSSVHLNRYKDGKSNAIQSNLIIRCFNGIAKLEGKWYILKYDGMNECEINGLADVDSASFTINRPCGQPLWDDIFMVMRLYEFILFSSECEFIITTNEIITKNIPSDMLESFKGIKTVVSGADILRKMA